MDYLKAAQPRIVALFLVTVLAAMLLAGAPGAWLVIAVLAATALTVAGAAILNNVLERDLDARMERTRRRPTATGELTTVQALVFSSVLCAAAGKTGGSGAVTGAGPFCRPGRRRWTR